jgi:hypothetical protein
VPANLSGACQDRTTAAAMSSGNNFPESPRPGPVRLLRSIHSPCEGNAAARQGLPTSPTNCMQSDAKRRHSKSCLSNLFESCTAHRLEYRGLSVAWRRLSCRWSTPRINKENVAVCASSALCSVRAGVLGLRLVGDAASMPLLLSQALAFAMPGKPNVGDARSPRAARRGQRSDQDRHQ